MADTNQDKLKREEQDNLDETIERMDEEILRLNKNWKQKDLDRKKQKDACLPDTYGALVDDNDDKYWIANKSKYIQQGRDELYGHRIEVHYVDQFDDHEEGDQELKIGLHTYMSGPEIFICSWKRPICRHYLMDNAAVEFVGTPEKGEEGYETVYTLKQKRQIKLDFDRVQEVIPLYFENATEETEKIVSDEFLKELLERRSETVFKNIIFSIQKKQGEIIQMPFKQNIIVQGCAGSGKSMIMLHRLPILMYDNPDDLDLTNIYIVTPSISYIQQAQNMLYQLEIADLSMGTIDQYYQYLLSKYRRSFMSLIRLLSYLRKTWLLMRKRKRHQKKVSRQNKRKISRESTTEQNPM